MAAVTCQDGVILNCFPSNLCSQHHSLKSLRRVSHVVSYFRPMKSCRRYLQRDCNESAMRIGSVFCRVKKSYKNELTVIPNIGYLQNSTEYSTTLNYECEQRHEHNDRGAPLMNRRLSLLLASALVSLGTATWSFPARAAAQIVKLKNVDSKALQDALRAAIAGDLGTAEALFTQLLAEEPHSASIWSNRGSVRLSMEKFEEATEDFGKAIALAPDASVPYLNRAIAFEALGRYKEAIQDCETAIANDPNEAAAWFNLGNVQAKVQDFDASFAAFEKSALLAPGIAGYRLREAQMLVQLDRLRDAEKMLQSLVRKYPNFTEAHASLAAVFWREGKRGNAEEEFTAATLQESKYKDIRWVKANLQWPPQLVEALDNFLGIK
eukprot:jgi/Mesen1/1362/ME000013S00852